MQKPVNLKRYLGQLLISLALAVFFVYLSFKDVSWSTTFSALRQIRLTYLGAAFLCILLSFTLKWVRWTRVLAHFRPGLRMSKTFASLLIGFFINCVIPVKIGELARILVIAKQAHIAKSTLISVVAIERVFDGLAILLLFFIAIQTLTLPAWVHLILNSFALLFIMAFFVLYFLAFANHKVKQTLNQIAWLKTYTPGFLKNLLGRTIEALTILKTPRLMFLMGTIAFLAWSVEAVMLNFILLAFNFHLPFTAGMLLLGILNFGMIILQTPGGIGPFEFIVIKTLGLFAISQNDAAACALVTHFCLYAPFVIGGCMVLPSVLRYFESFFCENCAPSRP